MLLKNLCIIMLLACNLSYSQIMDKDFMWLEDNSEQIKQITISKNNNIGIVQRFNKQGQPYYIKNSEFNGKGIIAIWYFHYDKNYKIDKTVFAHSNLGFERKLYRRAENSIDVFTYYSKEEEEWDKELKEKGTYYATVGETNNSDLMKHLKKISDTTSLLEAKGYLNLTSRKKYLSKSIILNSKQEEIASKTFTYKRKIDSESTTTYSKNKKVTTFSEKSFAINDVVTKVYNDSGNILSENGNFSTVTYKYDNDKLVEKIEYDGGKPRISITYKYTRGLLSEEIYEDIKSGRKWRTKYKYNNVGKIITKIRTEDDVEAIYNYEYTYW